jgi:hypothetical protein
MVCNRLPNAGFYQRYVTEQSFLARQLCMLTTNDSVVKANAKESLNFHINLYIYAIVFALLILVAIGIPLLAVLAIVSFIMPVLAILHVLDDPNSPYRYPFIFRVV